MIKQRLSALRAAMKEKNINCYIIPTSDYHNSEYVSEYFMVRKYFSGFIGSAGVLVVFQEKAALFTDGRYFIQAEAELAGSGILLMKQGEPDVPGIRDYVKQELKQGQNIGFDARVMTAKSGKAYEDIAKEKGGEVIWKEDLAEEIWFDRPKLSFAPVFLLDEKYSGESCQSKLMRLREKMEEEKAQVHLLTTLDDIAWLFNLRGNDVECCPVLLSYAAITKEEVYLFADESAFGKIEKEYLQENHIILRPYHSFYDYVAKLVEGTENLRLLLCEEQINYRLKREISDRIEVLDKPNPTTLMKAVKNQTEQENLRKAHLLDAIAVTKFMYWLKENVGKCSMTEVSVAERLEDFRKEQASYIEPSFSTISAYGANGAIIHYSAMPDSCAQVADEGLLMVDSGGHYYEGSTDITRTFVLGEITEQMKQDFTLVVRAMLRLKNIRFLHGCNGLNLDLAAREVFWQKGLDYKHGTGHGVGYLLNVHEGPNSFRYKTLGSHYENWVFEEGMVTTDEPGIYRKGSHGIRIENELLCRNGEKNEFGQFMYFEDLTYVPIDLEGIDTAAMEQKEIEMLNSYHQAVYEKLSPYFEGEERNWLAHVTRAL